MDLKSNIVDPYIGQTAEGKKIEFESTDSIKKEEFNNILKSVYSCLLYTSPSPRDS